MARTRRLGAARGPGRPARLPAGLVAVALAFGPLASCSPEDASSFELTSLPDMPILGGGGMSTATDGRLAFVWGGCAPGTGCSAQGALFDLKSRLWREVAPSPLTAREGATVSWVGDRFFVAGGTNARGVLLTDAASYLPDVDQWRTEPDAPGGLLASVTPPTWNGDAVVYRDFLTVSRFGGFSYAGRPAVFYPRSRTWRVGSPYPGQAPEAFPGMSELWTDMGLLVALNTFTAADGLRLARYEPAGDSWTELALPIELPGAGYRLLGSPSLVIVASAQRSAPIAVRRDGQWDAVDGFDADGLDVAQLVWTGQYLVAWPKGGLALDITHARTTTVPTPPTGRYAGATPIWTGDEVLVLGGMTESGDPVRDAWSLTPSTARGRG